MVLTFFKKPDGTMCALALEAGTVFSADEIDDLDVSGDVSRIRFILEKMTKDQIFSTVGRLGFRPSNKSATKQAAIDTFLNQWETIYNRAQMISTVQAAQKSSSSSTAQTTTTNTYAGKAHRLDDEDDAPVSLKKPWSVCLSSKGALEQIDGKDYKPNDTEEWTERDQTALDTLQKLNNNPMGMKVDSDKLRELETKKKRCEAVAGGYANEVIIKCFVFDYRVNADFGTMSVQANLDESVCTLTQKIAEKLFQSICRSGSTWKQVIRLRGKALTNVVLSLQAVGISAVENIVNVELYGEDDARFKTIMETPFEPVHEESESDDEWAQCYVSDLYNKVEEEDVMNPKEEFPADAKVVFVRVVRNTKDDETRIRSEVGACLRMDIENATIKDFMKALEDYKVVDDADDFHVLFNCRPANPEAHIKQFMDDTETTCTFALKVAKLRGGGVRAARKALKRDDKIAGIKERFVVVQSSNDLAQQGMKIAHDIFNSDANDIVSNEVGKMSLGKCQELQELWDEGQKGGERFICQIAPVFLPIIDQIQQQTDELQDVKASMTTAFEVAFAREFLTDKVRYDLSSFHECLCSRIDAIEREADVSRRVQQALRSKSTNGTEDVAME